MSKGTGKQAKVLTPAMERAVLSHIESSSRYPARDRVIFLFSVKAGLRAIEIGNVTWSMVTDGEGSIGDTLALPNIATKGRTGGRTIALHKQLRAALIDLAAEGGIQPDMPVIRSERGNKMNGRTITKWFIKVYTALGWDGVTSHSGRRTFITNIAREISAVGGSIRDVQNLAGHSSLENTRLYIDAHNDAQKRVIDRI